MKKIITFSIAAMLVILTACAGSKKEKAAEESPASKVLVAYFSATGTTEKVAQFIAENTGGTLLEITPEQPYTEADLDWRDKESRSSVEMADSTSRPAISNKKVDAALYDVIYLGFPIWWDMAPTVVNTFIDTNDFDGKTVIPFATSGGSTIDNSVKVLRQTYPEIKWKKGGLLNDATKESVEAWINDYSYK